jgi:spermidine synthase
VVNRSVRDYALALACAAAVVWAAAPAAGEFTWSPYYKIRFESFGKIRDAKSGDVHDFGRPVGCALTVNNDYHQMLLDLGPDAPDHAFQREWRRLYELPYTHFRGVPEGPVLVVGAGTGNDVSAALRRTKRKVHAVDIDPAIIELGRKNHFEKPYESDRVTVFVDDARSFFEKTEERYAMVVFGYLDSHRLLSSFTSVRLDNFVYTRESLERVKRILRPGGVVVITFATFPKWMHRRMGTMLGEVFEGPVFGDYVARMFPDTSYVYGAVYAARNALGPPGSGPTAGGLELPRDNWPFLYLKEPGIPSHYKLFIAVIVVLGFVPLLFLPRGERRIRIPYFLLGAGFFLVETSNIVSLSILFGSTWWVNVLVFAGILVLVLLGNLTAAAVRRPKFPLIFALLGLNVVVALLTPTSALLAIDSMALRCVAAVAVFLGPVYFAAVIFATLIRSEANLYQAYGSNVLGAVIGGACEYTSMVFGFKFLLVVTLAIYLLAFLFLRLGRTVPGLSSKTEVLPRVSP